MSCPYYTFRQNDYYCNKNSNYVNSDMYYRYCRGYSYDECRIYKNEPVSGCYLTTIVCNLLGKEDNDVVLNTLRGFRDNHLKLDMKYLELLLTYDIVGPLISAKMKNDKKGKELANYLYNNVLVKVVELLNKKDYMNAIKLYKEMTIELINRYNLNEQYLMVNEQVNVVDIKELGHGKSRVLRQN